MKIEDLLLLRINSVFMTHCPYPLVLGFDSFLDLYIDGLSN